MRRLLRAFSSRLVDRLLRERRERELTAELDSHLQHHVDDNIRVGMPPDEARRAAVVALGGIEPTKERYRDQRGLPMLDTLMQDLSYAVRMLRRAPGFTTVAVVTLALGIGANTAVFSVVNAVLLRPLPYPDPDRLVMLWEDVRLPSYQNERNTPAPGNFHDWRAQSSAYVGMAAVAPRTWSLAGSGEPVRIDGEAISAALFSVLQVQPALGRAFTDEDDRSDSPHVVIIGHDLWIGRYGADAGIVGRTIRLNDEPYTVVGIMPRGFHFPDADDELWTPIALTPEQLANHGSHFLRVVARLKSGVSIAQASAELNIIAHRLTAQYPVSNSGVGANLVSLRDQVVGNVRPALIVMLSVVGLLLLMVCANVGSLLLARASARHRELATRVALGAGRARLVRQLLTESVLLAAIGGAAGLAVAAAGIDLLRTIAPANLPRLDGVVLDYRVAAFALVVSLLAGLVFGTIPALQTTDDGLRDAIAEDRRGSSGPSHAWVRSALVVVETALGVVVLVSAGLLLRSFVELQRIPLGFEPARVLTFRVQLPPMRYATVPVRAAFYRRLADSVAPLPGVSSVGGISFLPLTLAGRTMGITIEGQPPPGLGQVPLVDFRSVTPGYFQTMAIPIVSGRDVSWTDTPDRAPVLVVSDSMARTFWPNVDPLGRRLKLGAATADAPWLTVVGVVGTVHQLDLKTTPRPAMYYPATQDQGTGDTVRDWAVRTSGAPAALASAVRAAVWSIDPTLPISRVQTMTDVHATYLGPQQFSLSLVGSFGVLALLLAAVGLYGVTAYSVAQRTREIGIRMALGAQPSEVVRLIVRQGAKLTIAGIAIGSATALASTEVMRTMLFGIGVRDPVTFGAVAGVLIGVALMACYIPARRAARVSPMTALRTGS